MSRLLGLVVWLLCSAAFPLATLGQTPTATVTPTFGGSCCSARPGQPGCEDPACTTCVCNVDDICCTVGWDDFCVGIAEDSTKTGCAGACPCVSPTPTQQPTATPGGDCCAPHAGPGCDDAECQECVCNDPVCCSDEWDAECVGKAIDDCPKECGCNVGTPTPTPSPGPTFTPGGECCEAHASPSCDDSRCRECVCGEDEVCCNLTWDDMCVSIGRKECVTECACEPVADCCAAHETAGCDELRCQDCVCEVDDFCCDVDGMWDADCVGIAGADCALECTCDAGAECCSDHEGVGCNVLSCQDCVCERDDFCCSLDPENPGRWDQDCVDLASNPDDCGAECPCGTADCCLPHGGIGCDEPQCESCVCGIDAPCCTVDGWDLTCAQEAMTDCDSRCSCEVSGEGECCEPHDSPGCELSACEQCVCDEDEFCCDSSIGEWDRGCVDLASRPDLCAAFCGCDPLSDCCFGRAVGAGCDQPACEECVCDVDDFCCSIDPKNPGFWDDGCSDIAKNPDECGFACSCRPPCDGDCRSDGQVTVDELIISVDIAMGGDPSQCPRADTDSSGTVSTNEIVRAVERALTQCPP